LGAEPGADRFQTGQVAPDAEADNDVLPKPDSSRSCRHAALRPLMSGRQWSCQQNALILTVKCKGGDAMSGYLQNFDLTNGYNILRIICGAFFIPHIWAKFFVPEALGFFVAAKFKPPATWMYVACVIEIVLAIGLILAVYPVYVGLIAAIHLTVATIAVYRVTGGKWLWNIGGCEYPLFWAICCVVVAMQA
jgi:putative oxidoreductase